MTTCPVCSGTLARGLVEWHRACLGCGFEASTLEPRIDADAGEHDLDEGRREAALRTLRRRNFETLLDQITLLCEAERPLLEVGSAHGWFLEQCADRGVAAEGVEPDRQLAEATQHSGLTVRRGLFPEVLSAEETFGAIVFNDVFEHLPDVPGALAACARHLDPGGLLVINLPCSSGVFYRTSKFLARWRLAASFERMWQKGFPSPHLSYFSADGLREVCDQHCFDEIVRMRLPSLVSEGLWERIRFGGDGAIVVDALKWGILTAGRPLLDLLPADISLQVFRLRRPRTSEVP